MASSCGSSSKYFCTKDIVVSHLSICNFPSFIYLIKTFIPRLTLWLKAEMQLFPQLAGPLCYLESDYTVATGFYRIMSMTWVMMNITNLSSSFS